MRTRDGTTSLQAILGANVAFFRRGLGLSQEELAKAVRVNEQTIWRVQVRGDERQRADHPSRWRARSTSSRSF